MCPPSSAWPRAKKMRTPVAGAYGFRRLGLNPGEGGTGTEVSSAGQRHSPRMRSCCVQFAATGGLAALGCRLVQLRSSRAIGG